MYHIGKEVPIVYKDWLIGDIKDFDIDNTKIKRIGFQFDSDFDTNLKKVVDHFKAE
jgi:hypothetical protein